TLHSSSAWPVGFVPAFGSWQRAEPVASPTPVGVEVWQWRNVQLIAIAIPGGKGINPLPYIPQLLPNPHSCNTALLCRLKLHRCTGVENSPKKGRYRSVLRPDTVVFCDRYRSVL